MSYQALVIALLFGWIAIGVGLGIVMERRGYSGFGWGVVGAVLGPLGVLVALLMRLPPAADEVLRPGQPGPGALDVLVGMDGSSQSVGAASNACTLFGARLGRLTLAAVVPLDATAEEQRVARRRLDAAVATLDLRTAAMHVAPACVILRGVPAAALREHARAHGYHALAIGSHGRGASKAVLGSTAASLVRESEIPVIVTPPAAAPADQQALAS